MKVARNKKRGLKVKHLFIGVGLITGMLMLSAFRRANCINRDIVTTLGIPEPIAQQYIIDNFTGSWFLIPRLNMLKKIALADRAKVARDLGLYVKEYTSSKEFLRQYEVLRETNRPKGKANPIPLELKNVYRENFTSAIILYKKLSKDYPGDEQQRLRKQIELIEEQLKGLDDPNPALTKWKKDFPAYPSVMIRTTLEKFLELTSDIDYQATIKDFKSGNHKIFANQEYEAKSALWKMCFRAGKESTETVRVMAREWIEELKYNDVFNP